MGVCSGTGGVPGDGTARTEVEEPGLLVPSWLALPCRCPSRNRQWRRTDMSSPARERWSIRIEPLASTVPAINRVRSALKVLLRAFRLKCTAVLNVQADGTEAARPSSPIAEEP